jgi:hypothetical protein
VQLRTKNLCLYCKLNSRRNPSLYTKLCPKLLQVTTVSGYLGMRSSLHKMVLDEIMMMNANHRSTKEKVRCSNSDVGKIFRNDLDQP